MNKRQAKILIVDDHPLVRAGFHQLIAEEPDLSVCGEASNQREALQIVKKTVPDVTIIDISLRSGSGLDLIKRLHAKDPAIRILVASMYEDSIFAERALKAGASGYINKREAPSNILNAVRQVLKGEVYLSPKMTEHMQVRNNDHAEAPPQPAEYSVVNKLTDREVEVFDLIGRGLSTNQIADKLHLSVKTIETHRAHIKEKLNIHSNNLLVLRAMQWTLGRQ